MLYVSRGGGQTESEDKHKGGREERMEKGYEETVELEMTRRNEGRMNSKR